MEGEFCSIDAMDVGGKISVNVASVGLDAKTAKLMPTLRRVPFMGGKLSYLISLGVAFFTATKNRIAFEIDGELLDYGKKDCIIASIANGRYYGGGFQTAPRACMDDGEMDFLCVPSISRLKFLRCVGSYKKGEHLDKFDFIHYRRCKSLRLLSDRPIWVNVDGEVFSMENPCVRILEKALKVILPQKDGIAQGE
jgi:diacylglycerol kinase family enzyme